MGSFTETLRLLVEADTKGAVTEVEKLGKVSEREASKSKDALDKWGNGLTKVGAGMIAFGATALVGLGHAAQAYEEAHLSELKLENTLHNAPKLIGENKQQFLDLADAIQDKTAADGDAIVEGEALLGTFQLTAKEIKGITPLVVDYARKFGVDIPQASIQVGKALDGQVGALKRNGVSIDETLYKTDRYAAVQKALSEQVGGFAEAEGKTFAGSLERLKNQLGDLEEGVGKGAVDAFTTLFGAVDGVTDRLNDLSPGAQNTIGKVATYGSVALIAAGATSTLVGQVIKARQNLGALGSGLKTVAENLWDVKGGAAQAVIGIGTIVAVGEAFDKIFPIDTADLSKLERDLLKLGRTGRVTGEAADVLGTDFDDLSDAMHKVGEPSNTERISNALDHITPGIDSAQHTLKEARQTIDDVDQALATLARRDPKAAAQAFDEIVAGLDGISKSQALDLLDQYDDTLATLETEDATSGVGELGAAMDDSAESTENATSALDTWHDTLRSTFDPLFGMTDALQANGDAHAELEAKQLAAFAAQDKYNDAVERYGEDSKAAREAAFENMDAQKALTDAQRSAQDAVVDLQGAAYDLRSEMNENGLTAEDAKAKFIEMATQMGYTRGEAENLAGGFGFATGAAQTLGRQRPTPHVAVTGWSSALNHLATVGQNLHDLDGDSATVNVRFATSGFGNLATQLATLGMGPGRARGGPVFADRLYPVAEGGKSELLRMGDDTYLIPGDDGEVIPSDKIPALAGAGFSAAPIVQHFHIAGSVIAENQLVELVNKRTRKGRGLN